MASVRSTAGANLIVTRKGVAAENGRNFKTLDTFVRVNNHTDYVIDYLKVCSTPKRQMDRNSIASGADFAGSRLTQSSSMRQAAK